jgi:cobalt-zinc-cadmium efflux system outer membrane protein
MTRSKSSVQLTSLLTSLFLFIFGYVNGQPSHSLSDILAFTLMKNPQLHSYSYDLRAADARTLQAGFRPNPGLDVETENIGAPIFMQTTFLLSQLIELGGKRQARQHFAKSERERVALDYEVLKRQLYVDTTLLFIEVLISQQKMIFLEENLKVLQDFSSIVEKRLKAGKASIIEESNFLVMLNTARIDLKNAQTELKNAKNKLAAQWGEPNNDTFLIVGTLEWIPTVIPLAEMGEFIEEHPQIVRSHFEDNVRAARLRLEKSKAYPDANLRGGPRYLEEAHKWVWVVGVSIPLPIHDRNQGGIWESRENLEKMENEREALWIKLLTELNISYSTIQTVFAELNILKNAILPAAQKAYEFSYKGYELARYNYLELLETERAYRTSKIRYLQALGEYHKALAMLQGLTGSKAIIKQQCE